MPVDCLGTSTCMAPNGDGAVSGDQVGAAYTVQDSVGRFLKVVVRETKMGTFDALAAPMKARFQLESPQGSNFDLFIYQACGAAEKSSEDVGGVDSIAAEPWGETGTFGNNMDDTRTYIVEVRNVSGNCKGTDLWKLTVEGNK
jgi:hypothetical protein